MALARACCTVPPHLMMVLPSISSMVHLNFGTLLCLQCGGCGSGSVLIYAMSQFGMSRTPKRCNASAHVAASNGPPPPPSSACHVGLSRQSRVPRSLLAQAMVAVPPLPGSARGTPAPACQLVLFNLPFYHDRPLLEAAPAEKTGDPRAAGLRGETEQCRLRTKNGFRF